MYERYVSVVWCISTPASHRFSGLYTSHEKASADVYVGNAKLSGQILKQVLEKIRSGNHEIHRWTGGAVAAGLDWSCGRVQDIDMQSGHIIPHTARTKVSKAMFLSFFFSSRLPAVPLLLPSPPSFSLLLLGAYYNILSQLFY